MKGTRVIDFQENNLHVMNYSIPFRGKVSREELLEHIYTAPERPDAIPYRTSYYDRNWGFCIAENKRSDLLDETYKVVIDATYEEGSLTVGEGYIKGQSDKEILLSTYLCHPSMANNELTGPVGITSVYQKLLERKDTLKYTYRFLYVPETIGSIAYLSQNYKALQKKLVAGLVVAMIGIEKPVAYKYSCHSDSLIDRAAHNVLSRETENCEFIDWSPLGGGDQRQYCSPGLKLPVGYFCRAFGGNYPEYHTSHDNLSIISYERMEEAVDLLLKIVETVEQNDTYINCEPYGEPQLRKRNLSSATGGLKADMRRKSIMYLLGYGDGEHDLISIADKLGISCLELLSVKDDLFRCGLLKNKSERVCNG